MRGMRACGFPGNPGGLVVSILEKLPGNGPRLTVDPRPWALHLASNGANTQVLGWYRQAKATERGGMGGEESERLIVPLKRGNRAHETP